MNTYAEMLRPDGEPVHYHVSLFQVGCLSDSDNGPYETAEDALGFAEGLVAQDTEYADLIAFDGDGDWIETDTFDGQLKRWQRGTYVIAVERCDFALKYCGEFPE